MDISRRNLLKMLGIAGGAAVVGAAGGYASRGAGAAEQGISLERQRELEGTYYAVVERQPPRPKATVWFADANSAGSGKSWPEKCAHIWDNAGFEDCVDKGDAVAIKLHTGERHRNAQCRPDLPRAVQTRVREAGGRPFVADTLTAYGGKTTTRASIKNHMMTALSHGLVAEACGCEVIPYCDGIGDSQVAVKIDGSQLTTAYVAKLLAEADAMIPLTHSKGHGCGMFGGAIKNLGIGGGSKQGKVLDHDRIVGTWDTRAQGGGREIVWDTTKCPGSAACPVYGDNLVQKCDDWCPWGAIKVTPTGMTHDPQICADVCRWSLADVCNSITRYGCTATFEDVTDPFPPRRVQIANAQIRYSDTAVAVHHCFAPGKVGYISLCKEICRQCDCAGYDDQPIVPNLGMLGSYDLAAVDAAFLDMVTASDVVPGGRAWEKGCGPGDEKFEPVNGQSPWFQVYSVERGGWGTTDYDLVTVDEPWLFPWFMTEQYEWDYGEAYRTLIPRPPDQPVDKPTAWYHLE